MNVFDQVGTVHILASSAFWIALTNSEGGAGFDILAAMRLELSGPEVLAKSGVAIASAIALFLFATRESAEERQYTFVLNNLFLAVWLASSLTLAFNVQKAREQRTLRRDESGRQQDDKPVDRQRNEAATGGHAETGVPAAVVVVLPRAWPCVLISLSFVSYTAPQLVRVALLESLRGAIDAFSNLCFVVHILMLVTAKRSAARRIGGAHFAVQLLGDMSSFVADLRTIGVTFGVTVGYFIGIGCVIFEMWLLTHKIQPLLVSRNRKLHDEIPVTIFRWLFQKGGVMMSLYCYFEAVGVGFDTRSTEDVEPWLIASTAMITHATLSAVLAATLIADARTSVSAILRGKAPVCVTVGFGMSLFALLLSLTLFAGREFSDGQQASLYSAAYVLFMLSWMVTGGLMAAGLSSPQTASDSESTTVSAIHGEGDRGATASPGRASFSAACGGGGMSVGI